MDVTFHLSTSSPLCYIGEPKYKQNNIGYQILRIVYSSTFDNFDNLISSIAYISAPQYRLENLLY